MALFILKFRKMGLFKKKEVPAELPNLTLDNLKKDSGTVQEEKKSEAAYKPLPRRVAPAQQKETKPEAPVKKPKKEPVKEETKKPVKKEEKKPEVKKEPVKAPETKKKKEEKEEPKILKETIHIVPLRKAYEKPYTQRAGEAVKLIIKYTEKNAKKPSTKISDKLNKAIWKNGAGNPPRKIKIKIIEEEEKATADLA